MSSEWMKVMLEEISRKKAEAEAARIEEDKRADEREPREPPQCGAESTAPPSSGRDRARG